MNKKQITWILAVIVLLILGYFALNMEEEVSHEGHDHSGVMPSMDGHGASQYATVLEEVEVPFNTLFKVADEWELKVIQFEPDARLADEIGSGNIASESDVENNPAIKVEFYKDGEYQHYQICFQSMKGMHSKKDNQIYFVDLVGYKNVNKSDEGKFMVDEVIISVK